MFPQRIVQQSLRRLAVHNPSAVRTTVGRFAAPAAVATGNYAQFRYAATVAPVNLETTEPKEILAKQRLNRPVSPHLTIYKPQITWYASMSNRIAGTILSGSLYIFVTAYLVSPLLGWHLESASLAAAFGALPFAAKAATKFTLALPFTFHAFNGVRHLIWDMGKQFTNQQIIRTGFTVVGLSVASALYLAFMV
ncbi:succinate dehydrogenase, cytochrome b556 subunit [Polytolypa hystricis UAMH7299]|uniref:Succinate dehydrogenase, cytochrome b556 subunit n=1 Tax=Polytolypa hystricis (strain UAMH7299) TaxID=1447883 RepID=A0A2B7Z1X0_POLH7|nr:succinate dehydrogenase, cytochrome b556 subunit [Polytolypa hystricis UAMH7299]